MTENGCENLSPKGSGTPEEYDVDARTRLVVVRAVRRKGRSTTKEIV